MRRLFAFAVMLLAFTAADSSLASLWKAGAAKVKITPEQFMPMSGYASRGAKHADGKLTDLWAKALVLETDDGQRALLITFDLIGIDRDLSASICASLAKKYGLKRAQIALNFSHTHTGPVVAQTLRPMHYMLLGEKDRRLVDAYAAFLERQVDFAVGEAIKSLAPAKLAWTSGTATFATNRRNNPAAKVPELRAAGKLKGPFDHDAPVLAVYDKDNKLRAVVFGYACHCTTLSSFQWSGDYAGYAQIELEKAHPGCIALFWAGCGGDQNPLPRRTVELAKQYGRQLAEAVDAALEDGTQDLDGSLTTAYEEIALPLGRLPSAEELKRDAKSTNKYIAARAKHWLRQIEDGKPMSQNHPYPVQTWHLGDQVQFVFLGGEVVVDYAVRLKAELGNEKWSGKNFWVAGYSNDVMAYIPSRRVLTEGGYEGGGAMIYYGLPTVWAAEVEEVIVREVARQVKR